MLLQNFTLHSQYPYRRQGADATATTTGKMRSQWGLIGSNQLTRFASMASYSNKAAIPYGYSPGLFMPMKPGGISSVNEIAGSGSLSGALAKGINIDAALAGTGSVSEASLSMLVQAVATLTGSGSLTASMVGSVSMAANLAGSGDLAGALNVIAFCVANLTGVGAISSNLTGTARLEAAIYVNEGTATTEQMAAEVWNSLAASFNESGTMGEKLNSAGAAADPWSSVIDGAYTAEEIMRIIAASVAGKLSGAATTTIAIRDVSDTKDRITATVDADGNRTAITLDPS